MDLRGLRLSLAAALYAAGAGLTSDATPTVSLNGKPARIDPGPYTTDDGGYIDLPLECAGRENRR